MVWGSFMQVAVASKGDNVKKILIEEVSNGYLVTIEIQGVKSLFDEQSKQFVAADAEEMLKIVKENTE